MSFRFVLVSPIATYQAIACYKTAHSGPKKSSAVARQRYRLEHRVSIVHCLHVFINTFDFFGTMKALQSPDYEMALAHILKMINEYGVDYGAA